MQIHFDCIESEIHWNIYEQPSYNQRWANNSEEIRRAKLVRKKWDLILLEIMRAEFVRNRFDLWENQEKSWVCLKYIWSRRKSGEIMSLFEIDLISQETRRAGRGSAHPSSPASHSNPDEDTRRWNHSMFSLSDFAFDKSASNELSFEQPDWAELKFHLLPQIQTRKHCFADRQLCLQTAYCFENWKTPKITDVTDASQAKLMCPWLMEIVSPLLLGWLLLDLNL